MAPSVTEQSPTARAILLVTDRSGIIVHANAVAEDAMPQGIVGLDISEVLPQQYVGARAMLGPTEWEVDDCEPVGDACFIRLIEAPEAKARRYLRALTDTDNRIAIFGTDENGTISFWSRGAAQLFGYAQASVLGNHVDIFRGTRELPTNQAISREFITVRNAENEELHVQLSTMPVGSEEVPLGMLWFVRDVADLREMNDLRHWIESEELRQLASNLERENRAIAHANRLKSNFLANMSHELRTPLNAVLGFAKLLRGERAGPLNEKQRHYLDRVLEGGEHLMSLISELLEMARLESGELEFRLQEVDLGELCRETLALVEPLASPKKLKLSYESDATQQPSLTDPVRFKQVLYNYLSNAVKFTRTEGTITARIRDEGVDQVRIEVQDTGVGIPEDRLAELFTEFTQLENPMSKENQGIGLGLAITRRIVEAMGGEVGVDSTPGVGSTFYAVLPRFAQGPDGKSAHPDQKG